MFGGTLNVRNPLTGSLIAALPASRGYSSSPIVVGGRIILPTGGSTAEDASSSTVYVYHVSGR